MILPKDIKPGYIYNVEFEDTSFKEVVLAKNENNIVIFILEDTIYEKKDIKKLLQYKMNDFFENDKDVILTYDEQIIIYNYDKKGNVKVPVCPGYEPPVVFLKEIKKF